MVKDLPERFTQLRSELLQQASYLAHLPRTSLDAVTSAEAKYLVGWSHGKETLKPGVYDTLKGSYYVNCAFHADPSLSAAPVDPRFPNFPEYTAPNVWPTESELPNFRATLEALCNLIIDVAVLVARSCDRYAEAHIDGYESSYLENMVKGSLTTKARLLHYFPPDPSTTLSAPQDDEEDSWCATHVDHGCLTGLTSALFIDESEGVPTPGSPLPPLKTLPKSPDPKAGLYIRSRTGQTTKVGFPADCLAFQTGEALERITQGKFRAVPHFVRGPEPNTSLAGAVSEHSNGTSSKPGKVARNTLAVFTQPNLGEIVDPSTGLTFAEFAREIVGKNT